MYVCVTVALSLSLMAHHSHTPYVGREGAQHSHSVTRCLMYARTLSLMHACSCTQLVPLDKVKSMLKSKSITPERLEAIFDRYDAWGPAVDEHQVSWQPKPKAAPI